MAKNMKETVTQMADLAQLELSKSDLEKYTNWAEKIIKYFEKLNELDTKDVEPTSHAVEISPRLRDDTVKKFEDTKKIMDELPKKEGMFVEVPKII